MTFFINLLLAGSVLLLISLQKTYSAIPVRELKRRAREGDELARLVHRAASYGRSLRETLWILIGVLSGLFFLSVWRGAPTWFALAASVSVIWIGFVWLPATRVTRFGSWVAAHVAPFLAWLLNYLHPLLEKAGNFIRRHRPLHVHTGLYDKHDLVELITKQQVQADNRIDKNALEITKHALQFGDQLVRNRLTPRRVVKMVSADETVGPILMDEMHKSGHSRFPVFENKHDNIVGTLYMRDLVSAKSGGTVRQVMKKEVTYVHEEQTLYEALQAILKTHHHLLIVVNSFEEYVGIITLEDIIEQIIGKPILDEFDQYQDLRAVAARMAKPEHEEHVKDTPEA